MRRFWKICISLSVAVASLPTIAAGQSASEMGLVLKGGPSPSTRPCDGRKAGQECRKFRMVFENHGIEPIIIINPTLSYGSGIKEARFYYEEYGKSPQTVIHVEGSRKPVASTPEQRNNFRASVTSFDVDRPPENLTIILEPGGNYVFYESFLLDEDERIPEKEFETIRLKHPVNDECDQKGCRRIPYGVKLVYQFSFLPYIEDPQFLPKLAERWRRYGRIPMGEEDTYLVTSELIRVSY